jgi:hypothetical protein
MTATSPSASSFTDPEAALMARSNPASRRALKRMNDNEGKITAATAEERVAETAEDLAELTISFEGLSCGDLQGKELFHAVYSDPALGFITKQVTKHLADWGNFKPGSNAS